MYKCIIYFIILFYSKILFCETKIEPDFVLANINQKKFETIPKNTLFIAKIQGMEPVFFYEKELRGFGWGEPFYNSVINKLRKNGQIVYVDYITPSKFSQYKNNSSYQVCIMGTRRFEYYRNFKSILKKNNKIYQLYRQVSIPFMFQPVYGKLMTLDENLDKINKHLFPDSQILNIKSLLDDPNLYTANVTHSGSAIKGYYYKNPDHELLGIYPQYKKRVYDFVASNGEQLTFMISLRRMHWVDSYLMGDYHYQVNKNKLRHVNFLPFTHKDPKLLTIDDHSVSFFYCTNKDNKNLTDTMSVINQTLKQIRTNKYFLSQIVKTFSEKTKIHNGKLEDFDYLNQNILSKKIIDSEYYDK